MKRSIDMTLSPALLPDPKGGVERFSYFFSLL